MTNSHIIKAEEWFQELRNNLISDISTEMRVSSENLKYSH